MADNNESEFDAFGDEEEFGDFSSITMPDIVQTVIPDIAVTAVSNTSTNTDINTTTITSQSESINTIDPFHILNNNNTVAAAVAADVVDDDDDDFGSFNSNSDSLSDPPIAIATAADPILINSNNTDQWELQESINNNTNTTNNTTTNSTINTTNNTTIDTESLFAEFDTESDSVSNNSTSAAAASVSASAAIVESIDSTIVESTNENPSITTTEFDPISPIKSESAAAAVDLLVEESITAAESESDQSESESESPINTTVNQSNTEPAALSPSIIIDQLDTLLSPRSIAAAVPLPQSPITNTTINTDPDADTATATATEPFIDEFDAFESMPAPVTVTATATIVSAVPLSPSAITVEPESQSNPISESESASASVASIELPQSPTIEESEYHSPSTPVKVESTVDPDEFDDFSGFETAQSPAQGESNQSPTESTTMPVTITMQSEFDPFTTGAAAAATVDIPISTDLPKLIRAETTVDLTTVDEPDSDSVPIAITPTETLTNNSTELIVTETTTADSSTITITNNSIESESAAAFGDDDDDFGSFESIPIPVNDNQTTTVTAVPITEIVENPSSFAADDDWSDFGSAPEQPPIVVAESVAAKTTVPDLSTVLELLKLNEDSTTDNKILFQTKLQQYLSTAGFNNTNILLNNISSPTTVDNNKSIPIQFTGLPCINCSIPTPSSAESNFIKYNTKLCLFCGKSTNPAVYNQSNNSNANSNSNNNSSNSSIVNITIPRWKHSNTYMQLVKLLNIQLPTAINNTNTNNSSSNNSNNNNNNLNTNKSTINNNNTNPIDPTTVVLDSEEDYSDNNTNTANTTDSIFDPNKFLIQFQSAIGSLPNLDFMLENKLINITSTK